MEHRHGQRQPRSVGGRPGQRTAGCRAFLGLVLPAPGPRVVDMHPSARRACLLWKTPACAAGASSLPASVLSPGSHCAPRLRSPCPRRFTLPGLGRVPRPGHVCAEVGELGCRLILSNDFQALPRQPSLPHSGSRFYTVSPKTFFGTFCTAFPWPTLRQALPLPYPAPPPALTTTGPGPG